MVPFATSRWEAILAEELERRIWQTLTDGTPLVLSTHVQMDGDAVGATLGLWHVLRDEGVEALCYLPPPVPRVYRFLPGVDEATAGPENLPPRFHLVLLDCANGERARSLVDARQRADLVINIDHHATNPSFGDVNYVDVEASSSGELVCRILRANGVEPGRAAAQCLYAAILTDTGRFGHSNTTAASLEVCAELVRLGASPHDLARRIYDSPSPAQVRLRALAAQTLQFAAGGKVAVVKVTAEMLERTGLDPADTQELAAIPICIDGVQAGILLKQMAGGGVKVSLRSRGEVDVRLVAESFGGGGHVRAAGYETDLPLEAAVRTVVEKVTEQLQGAAAS